MALGSPETNGEADVVDLVERARAGDKDAFGRLASRYEQMVFVTVCKAMRGKEASASDMTQEVFLNAYLKIGQLVDPKAFGAWLRTIARRMAINGLKNRRFAGGGFQQPEDDFNDWTPDPLGPTPQEILIEREERSALEAAVSSMSDVHRRVVELFYVEDRPLKEIIGILSIEEGRDVPMGTIKRRLHAARNSLRSAIAD